MLELNYLGIIIAASASMFLGAFWYSPRVFGNQWIEALGKTSDTLDSAIMPMISAIIANVAIAVGVAAIFAMVDVSSLSHALCIGAILGFFIILPNFLSDYIFCDWGMKLLAIQSGYRIVAVMLISLIIYLI